MKRLLLGAAAIAAIAVAASAGRVGSPNGLTEQVAIALGAVGADAVPVDRDHPLPVADRPRLFGESSAAASYSFSAAGQAAARGWYANCGVGVSATVTLTDTVGGTARRALAEGWQDNDDALAGFSGNSGCVIGLRV